MRPLVDSVQRLQRLAVFEAAARLGSFTAAGIELGIAQPAVTRQIRALERSLGVELFHRTSNRSSLSPAGRELHERLDHAFTDLENTIRTVQSPADRFVLAAPPGFAQQLIVPHIDVLHDVLGQWELRLWLYDRDSELGDAGFDAAVRIGDGAWPGLDSRELFAERVVPVATPALAEEWNLDGNSRADAVLAAPLLHMDARDRPWMSWTDWLSEFDLELTPGRRRLTFNNYPTVLQQAVAGRGVALGWRGLVEELVETGVLMVVGPEAASGRGYYLTWPRRGDARAIDPLLDWLGERIRRQAAPDAVSPESSAAIASKTPT